MKAEYSIVFLSDHNIPAQDRFAIVCKGEVQVLASFALFR